MGGFAQYSDHSFRVIAADGVPIAASRWTASQDSRALLVVSHGMGEHRLRYRDVLRPLQAAGYVVYAHDHRGHGATAQGLEALGDYGPGGFASLVDDLASMINLARSEHPDLPVLLLGHSMGSMVAQALVVDYPGLIDGLALSGSGAIDVLARVGQTRDPLAAFNAAFEPARTPFDWLSRDAAQVDAYIADPLCGFALAPDSALSLFSQGERLANSETLRAIPKDLPIYIFSGDRDPLAAELGSLQPLIERYRAAGLAPQVRLYPEARHEVLNEINRDEVVADLLDWCERTSATRTSSVSNTFRTQHR